MATFPLSTLPDIDTSRYECIDGQTVTERPVTNKPHSRVQRRLTTLLEQRIRDQKLPLEALPECSVNRYGEGAPWMTPDIVVTALDGRETPHSHHVLPPVYLGVEILSPGQTFNSMRKEKVIPALQWGFAVVWVIDPIEKAAMVFSAGAVAKAIFADDEPASLLEAGELQLSLAEIFNFAGDQP